MRNSTLDFLIIGAMKSGTTSLASALNQHPEVYLPKNELHYFDNNDYFSKGDNWYHAHFPLLKEVKAYGEKTPSYMYTPYCIERIFNYDPQIKLIMILRNPIDRTYSNYWHSVKNGKEELSFIDAIVKEDERIKNNIFRGYTARSKYIVQLEKLLEYFDLNKIKIVIFEELTTQPDQILKDIFQFLEVNGSFIVPEPKRKENITIVPRSIRFNRYSLNSRFRKVLRYPNKINKLLGTTGYPKMASKIRDQLRSTFEVYNSRLSELIEKDLNEIWQ